MVDIIIKLYVSIVKVSTVLLYDIPIVSLYIECQERLCLAQISNTLLKQFSYNEIHNRRVALGITCVQCTPVQLEILRRAGAMPVSSRRCGMITRREAERLCKSFLGDNAPPRLPEDFSFNVQHKCAWGCRGSFLPSRYNSSRAKCIKCTYCGLFFSPNKFIFHSHRISTNDKYIQPDAANFNSWRRHMMLCDQPCEEIIHAWEDVKAMFNGGTRKRIISTHSLTSSSPLHTINASKNADNSTYAVQIAVGNYDSIENQNEHLSQKRQEKYKSTLTAVSAEGTHSGIVIEDDNENKLLIRPLNLHENIVSSANLISDIATQSDVSLIPFSRSFMMDYMLQAHSVQNAQQHQQKSNIHNENTKTKSLSNASSCNLYNWVNSNGNTSFSYNFAPNDSKSLSFFNNCKEDTISGIMNVPSPLEPSNNLSRLNIYHEPSITLSQICNSSAFKPVSQLQKEQFNDEAQHFQTLNLVRTVTATVSNNSSVSTAVFSSKTSTSVSLDTPKTSLSSSFLSTRSPYSSMTNIFTLPTSIESPTLVNQPSLYPFNAFNAPITEKMNLKIACDVILGKPPIICSGRNNVKKSQSYDDDKDVEDDVMIDIESTEDDQKQLLHETYDKRDESQSLKCSSHLVVKRYESNNSFNEIAVDGNVNKVAPQMLLKKNTNELFYGRDKWKSQAIEIEERTSIRNSSIFNQHARNSPTSSSSSIEIVDNDDFINGKIFFKTVSKNFVESKKHN